MKKLIALFAFACLSCFAALAQPRAVGGEFTLLHESAFYQHSITPNQFIEVSLGLDTPSTLVGRGNVMSTFEYNFIFATFEKSKGHFDLYAGPAANIGYGIPGCAFVESDGDSAFFLDVKGQFGFDFVFNCHVQLFAKLGIGTGLCLGSYYDEGVKKTFFGDDTFRGLYSLIPTFGVAYAF